MYTDAHTFEIFPNSSWAEKSGNTLIILLTLDCLLRPTISQAATNQTLPLCTYYSGKVLLGIVTEYLLLCSR